MVPIDIASKTGPGKGGGGALLRGGGGWLRGGAPGFVLCLHVFLTKSCFIHDGQ